MSNDDYSVDIDAMPVEDAFQYALQDTRWGKKPHEFFSYLSIDESILHGFIEDLPDAEIVQIMRTISWFCITGNPPDYENIESPSVRLVLRSMIKAHESRMKKEYVKHYRQHLAVQKKKNKT